MKRYILVLLSCSLSLFVHAQLVDTHSSLTVSFTDGNVTGNQLQKDGGFVAPSLYANFSEMQGLSVSFLRKMTPFLSAGIDAGSLKATGWDYPGSNLFSGSRASMYSSSLVFRLHNPFSRTGIGNRLKIFAELDPSIGLMNYELGKNEMDFFYKNNIYQESLRGWQSFVGYKVSTGMDLAVSQKWGIVVAYTLQKGMLYGQSFMDDAFSSSGMTFGLSYRFHKDKRFYKYW